MIEVICWKWKPTPGYRSHFTGHNVNVLRHMVRRFLPIEHRFSCITDDPTGIEPGVRIIPLWDDFSKIRNPNVTGGPSCYRRLKAFSTEAKAVIGDRILSLDLDCVITDDLTPLIDRDDDFICWGDTAIGTHYNGGFWLLRAGTRPQVWETFDPVTSPVITRKQKIIGSDQAWISYILEGKDPKWGVDDGVYSFRNHIRPNGTKLPDNARIIFFHGAYDPWQRTVQASYPWVKKFYR